MYTLLYCDRLVYLGSVCQAFHHYVVKMSHKLSVKSCCIILLHSQNKAIKN